MLIKFGEDTGLCGFISWERLATELFRRGGEIRDNETITQFEVSDRGLTFTIATTGVGTDEDTEIANSYNVGE